MGQLDTYPLSSHGKSQEAFSLFSLWHQTFFSNPFGFFSVTLPGLVQQSSLKDVTTVLFPLSKNL